ncbi:hypothetical protein BC833DRAFT_585481 [Globomyces pollinis-pini]|nr:hypothetical protein BC833DRAFT_585481 [Globomyces pollinis-pini]
MLHSVLLGALVFQTKAFYLPGVAPHDYHKGDIVPLLVNALTAKDSLLPYDYYHPGFSFCKPPQGSVSQKESLGSILFGDRLFTSAFEIPALVNQTCQKLCTSTATSISVDFIRERVEEEYEINWIIDGLPAAQIYRDESTEEFFYNVGIPLGYMDDDTPILNNHYNIHIHYHPKDNNRVRVVGVVVNPASYSKATQDGGCHSSTSTPLDLPAGKEAEITYTYNVIWEEDKMSWGTRWDHYLHVYDPNIHWFSIINSIVIVLILSSMVTMILLRALHKDISRYNTLGDEDGAQDDFGWKMVHADVFRPPPYRMVLSVLLGTGAQLLCMLGVTLAFAVLGFLSPSSRGSLGTMSLIFYILFSTVSGYVSSLLYKSYMGENRKQNVLLTAVLVPGIIFGILVVLNFILLGNQSSAAVPFGTFIALIAMWFLVSIPLCILGSYFGFRQAGFQPPCKTNQIPRQIPPQPWYLNSITSALIGGILPFGAIFIELFFIMNSIWSHRLYYMFGFLLFVFLILVVTCCLVSILLTYFALCAENYLWVWKSFLASASSGLYIFLYSVVFYFRKLYLKDTASCIIYFTWSLVISILFGIFTGAVGHFASFLFVHTIYKAIKVD